MTIKLYTGVTCPRCQILKNKLNDANIPYQECTEFDHAKFRELKLMSLPIMEVVSEDNVEYLDFAKAILFINKLNKI